MLPDDHSRSRMVRVRTRMLTFRVTEDEHERLQTASNACGARCLSDFLRQAALDALGRWAVRNLAPTGSGAAAPAPSSSQQLVSVEQRLSNLEAKISALIGSLGSQPVARTKRDA
jgi:hypothetical protein